MGVRRILLLTLLIAFVGSKLSAATLTITFTGACDFVEKKDGTVRVVLPKWVDIYDGYGVGRPHRRFVRHEALAYKIATPAEIKIQVAGKDLTAAKVDTTQFNSLVHHMKGVPSEDVIKQGVVFELPGGGELTAMKKRDENYVFVSPLAKPKGDEKPEPMANEAQYVLTIGEKGKDAVPVTLKVGDVEFQIAFKNGAANVMIGNLPERDMFFEAGKYEPMCIDSHFLLHYTLSPPYNINQAAVPQWLDSSCVEGAPTPSPSAGNRPPSQPMSPTDSMSSDGTVKSFGSRENCFMGWWGM